MTADRDDDEIGAPVRSGDAGSEPFAVRAATTTDLPALRRVMDAAIEELQRHVLDPAQIEASRAIMGLDTRLVDDGTYLVVEHREAGSIEIAGCGGWSRRATMYGGDHSAGRDDTPVDPDVDPARVRAMYTNPRFARRGVGRRILEGCQRAAAAEGFRRLELVATMAGQPLYESFGFTVDETFSDDAGGTAVPLARMSKPIPPGDDAVSRYHALFALPADTTDEDLAAAAAACLAPGVVIESSRRPGPVVGREAVLGWLRELRAGPAAGPVGRGPIQRAGRSLRWTWELAGADWGSPLRGTDVATLSADGRIERLAVFADGP